MDIPDIEQVVQYMVPESLSVYTQRFGRAGRSGQPAIAILLAEPSVFQTKNSKKTLPVVNTNNTIVKTEILDEDNIDLPADDDDECQDPEYRKKLEDGLRLWCESLACRR
jgi:superfamily II DNA helicase RecQ